NNELADIELEGCIELSVFLGHGKSSMGIVSPIEVSGVIRPAQSALWAFQKRMLAWVSRSRVYQSSARSMR
ncbi:hypothetical protein, partial [Pseudomonas viridiflava]|uniref:hypothetical protein n=1 Tax=Pseudomonas viridiflava TaxID=33069 RepID=UPI0019D0AD86